MITGRPILNVGQIEAHKASLGSLDSIWNPLYDYQNYPTTGQLSLTFFSSPIGQGTTSAPGASGTKTEADTNMQNAGLLARGNRFYLRGIEVLFYPGGAVGSGNVAAAAAGQNWRDVYGVMKSAWLKLTIQNRDYILDGPLGVFPPTFRLSGAAAMSANTTAGADTTLWQVDYAAAAGMPYQLVPMFIEENQFFSVKMQWPALVTVVNAGRIGVRLLGELIRNAQ